MSMRVEDLRNWLDKLCRSLDKNAEVGVDEGGLTLRVVGNNEVYCEVGGLPLPPERDCHQCGRPYRIDDSGVANHVDDAGDIDYDADADHVPYKLPEED